MTPSARAADVTPPRSNTARNARSFNPFELQPADPDAVELKRFGVEVPNLLLGHEKAAYELRDSAALVRKLKGHLAAVARILDDLAENGRKIHVVQELGGFLSVLAAYYAARSRNIDNWFIEPSFFRGRVFFIRNSFRALPIDGPHGTFVSPEVAA